MALKNSFSEYQLGYKLDTGKDFNSDMNQYLSYVNIKVMEKHIQGLDEIKDEIHKLSSTIDAHKDEIHHLDNTIDTLKNRVDDLTEKIK